MSHIEIKIMQNEQFKKIMNELKQTWDFNEDYNKLFKSHNVDGYIMLPDATEQAIALLEIIFHDVNHWISYFVYELNWGKDYKLGDIVIDGEMFDLSTVDNLYDLLMKGIKIGEEVSIA